MPRPTAAQLAYGSATVVFSALAMLLLSGATSPLGAAVVAVCALALGLFVAVAVPGRARSSSAPAQTSVASGAPSTAPEPVSALHR